MLASCYKDKEDLLYGDDNCEATTVSFSADIMPIIQSECGTSGCHVQGGNGNGIFDNYSTVKAKVDNGSLENRVIVERSMPKGGRLTNCQIDYIKKWLQDGALNN